MKYISNILLTAALTHLGISGPPDNNATFPTTLSQCGGEYTSGEPNSTNYYRCDNWNDGIGYDDSDKFVTYDAYFNGTLNLNYIPLTSSSRRPYLASVNASLAIGQMVLPSNPQITRSNWDANNFFMSFTSFPPPCSAESTCAPTFFTLSDSSYWYWSQAWTLQDTKNGGGFDINGNITKTKFMNGNGLYFSFPADNTYTNIVEYDDGDLLLDDHVSMSGYISPSTANITFTVSNYSRDTNTPFATLQYVFSGFAWQEGAKLNTSGIHPTTTGQSKDAVASPANPTSTSSSSHPLSTIVGAAIGGGILLLLIFIGLIFCFCCGKVSMAIQNRKKQKKLDRAFERQQQQGRQLGAPVVYAPGQYEMQPQISAPGYNQPPGYAQK